jgi:hypothetical protein
MPAASLHVSQELFHVFALRRASRDRRRFSPVSALFRFVNDNLDFHSKSCRVAKA